MLELKNEEKRIKGKEIEVEIMNSSGNDVMFKEFATIEKLYSFEEDSQQKICIDILINFQHKDPLGWNYDCIIYGITENKDFVYFSNDFIMESGLHLICLIISPWNYKLASQIKKICIENKNNINCDKAKKKEIELYEDYKQHYPFVGL